MRALRRSLKGDKSEVKVHPHHASITPKDATAILPPRKVIRALYDYEANPQHPRELSFAKGDFFHVIGQENDPDWYEACNPSMPNARGLVPVQFFQVLGRTERDSAGSSVSRTSAKVGDVDSGDSERFGPGGPTNGYGHTSHPGRSSTSIGRGSGAMVYGRVMYDFAAERPDELEATAGEYIIVIAQSNPEWFVAKPIGRLGGPGLIPVSFIEIRDMTTGQVVPDPYEAVQRAGVPKVEEWKKMAADYKNSSISLGKFESGSSQRQPQDMDRLSYGNGRQSYQNGQSNGYPNPSHNQRTPSTLGPSNQNHYQQHPVSQFIAPVSASIPRWYFARDKYWYVIEAVMEDRTHWELSRTYQDFYDFQIALLKEFPEEAGNAGKPRTLPFMPGPVTYVTDQISYGRRQNLDEYIKKLLTMPAYISRCHLVGQLFAPRDVDFQVDPDAPTDPMYGRLSGVSQPSSNESPSGASRQSSRGNLNGTVYQPGLSAPPPRPNNHQRQQPSVTNGVAQALHYRNASDLQHPGMTRQASSLTQASNGSQTAAAAGNAAGGGAVKIKVYFQDDLIAVRVPTDVSFDQLKEKLQARLSLGGDIRIQYRDEPSNSYQDMQTEDDLAMALQRNPKLTLYVT